MTIARRALLPTGTVSKRTVARVLSGKFRHVRAEGRGERLGLRAASDGRRFGGERDQLPRVCRENDLGVPAKPSQADGSISLA